MGWWQYGLEGQNAFPTSGSVTKPDGTNSNLNNCKIIGSFSLNTGVALGEEYDILLNTFSLGTQLYLRCVPGYGGDTSLQVPAGATGRIVNHTIRLSLRAGGEWYSPSGNTYTGANVTYLTSITGGSDSINPLFSIYYYLYCKFAPQNLSAPAFAYPYGGSGAANTNHIAMVCTNTGADFYIIGHPAQSYYGGVLYDYPAPCTYIGSLPADYLNNPALFDPNEDAMSEEAASGTGGEGGVNIPGLPVSPSYPSDNIDFPDLPTGADAFGFSRLTLYKCTSAILADALDILYSDSTESTLETIIESCKKWWYKPDQYCISLMLSPVDASTSASKTIKFGKYDSEVMCPFVSSQWHVVDCGYINVPLKFGSFVDFEPHAKAKIFLPFVGFRSISINEIIGGTIYIKYYVDILTGISVCMLKVVKDQSSSSILYTYDCNTQIQVPLTANNYSQVISGLLSATLAMAQGNQAGALTQAAGSVASLGSPELSQSGSLSPNSGVLSPLTPYVAIQMPVPSIPAGYNEQVGRPSNVYVSLGSARGFTQCEDVHLSIPGATSEEISMIEDMLKRGVYF